MLKTPILPKVVAQGGSGMSQCFIELAVLVASVLRLPSLAPTKSHSATFAQLAAEDTWDEAERKPNGLLLQLFCYQLESFIPMHGLFSDCTLLVLALACKQPERTLLLLIC